ncbi:Hypothetical protein CINCED_3A018778 [Cinara cedri]|uniref:Uncharacterized protein n=1 Tax=Cinara cedri TaxID=506608 RepID=A0A5E4NCT5_9HEMI|nr:Hypothetical protein CINCED_3A018778 [Cinara cedri]
MGTKYENSIKRFQISTKDATRDPTDFTEKKPHKRPDANGVVTVIFSNDRCSKMKKKKKKKGWNEQRPKKNATLVTLICILFHVIKTDGADKD